MLSYIIKRLAWAIPTLFGVSVLIFLMVHLAPGDPALLALGEHANKEAVDALREQMGLNKSLLEQYFIFISQAIQGDFGISITSGEPVIDEFMQRFPATVELSLVSMFLAVVLGLFAGIISAVKRYSLFDYTAMTTALAGVSMPVFWLGLMLIYFFSIKLGWLPVSGRLGYEFDIDEVPHRLKLVGDVIGEQQRAAKFIDHYKKTVESIKRRTAALTDDKKPMAIHLFNVEKLRIAPYPWYAAAGANYPVTKWTNTDMEQILAWNPDIIYISNFTDKMPEDFYSNNIPGQDWSQVNAVKNRRVYKVPLGTYRWGPWNAESALMLWWTAQIQHPNLFNDYKIEDKIKDFYQEFYDYQLSAEEVSWILNPNPLKG